MTLSTAQATVMDNRIIVRTLNNGDFEQTLAACKRPRGGRWRKSERVWAYPLGVETCHDLRAAFGDALVVLPALAHWYREAIATASAHVDLSRATDASLPGVQGSHPSFYGRLRADQRVEARWCADLYRGAGLLASEPGTGKTWSTVASVLEADVQGPILVACPRLSVRQVWMRELHNLAPEERVYICRGTRAKRQRAIDRFLEDPAPRKWLITVMETLRIKGEKIGPKRYKVTGYEYPALHETQWVQVIIDESHKAFGSLTVVQGNLMGMGLKHVGTLTDRRLALTGTPFGKGGRLTGMFGTLHWLWPDEFTSFWRWAGQYFHIEEEEIYIAGGHGQKRTVKRIGDLKGGKSEEDFFKEFGPRIMRHLLTEVMPWLPEKRYQEVFCEMEGNQLRQYKRLVADAEVPVPGGVISANGVLAEITRSKQLANGALQLVDGQVRFDETSSGKIDSLLERLDARGILDDSGHMKVLVASQYNEFLDAVAIRLQGEGVAYLMMTGKDSDKKRDKLMDLFQGEGGPRVFLINMKAGGVSVTLDAADEVHCLDEDWDPGVMEQLEGRAQRASRAPTAEEAGKRPPVLVLVYRTEGTIDTNIGDDVEERRQNQHAVLDGRRGLAYVRDVIKYRAPKEDNE